MIKMVSVKSKVSLCCFVFCLAWIMGHPESAVFSAEGTAGGLLLDTPVNVRPQGMGGAFVAVADDVSCLFFNPSGLSFFTNPEASFTYLKGIVDTKYGFFGFGYPLRDKGTLGLGITGFHGGNIEVNETNADGSFKQTRTIKASTDWVGIFSYAIPFNETFSSGLSLKILNSTLAEEYSHRAVAGDIGFLFRAIDDRMALGLTLQNVGKWIGYTRAGVVLPTNLKAGLSIRIVDSRQNRLTVAADADRPFASGKLNLNFGIEYMFLKTVFLRAGYQQRYDRGVLTAGLGVTLKGWQLDYSYLQRQTFSENCGCLAMKFGSTRLLAIGRSFYEKGMYERAKTAWGKISPEDEDYAEAKKGLILAEKQIKAKEHYKLAKDYFSSGQYEDALKEYKEVQRRLKGYRDTDEKAELLDHIIKADALSQSGEYEESIQECDQALNLSPDYREEEFISKLKDRASRLLEIQKAREAKKKAEEERKKKIAEHLKAAEEYFEDKQWIQALKEWEQVLKLAPENEQATEGISRAKARIEEAKRNKLAEEHFNSGKEAYNRGDFPTAITEFEKVLELKPDSEPTRRLLEEAKRKAEERDRELERIKKMGRLNVAVCDFEARPPVSESESAFITDFFRDDIVKADVFNVVERNKMRMILEEQKFQQTGCTTSECAIELGHILNVQEVMIGSCGKLLDKFMIMMRIVEVETGKIIYSDTGECLTEAKSVRETVSGMVDKLIKAIAE